MQRETMTAAECVAILFGSDWDGDPDADFRSGADVCESLAEHFGFTEADYRLEYLRRELRAERISYSELAELQGLAGEIEAGDVDLLEAAGVPEHDDNGEES